MGFILSFISIVLFVIVHPINAIVILISKIKSRAYPRVTDRYFFTAARDLDIYGNFAYQATWNTLLISKEGYLFGNRVETISSALGKNQIKNTLSIFGWIIVYILWIIDVKYWFKGGHCINSIIILNDEDETIN